MTLNFSHFSDKLRIAAPDLVVGIVGVPIAFTFQHIADKVEKGDIILSDLQLYGILVILILCYLTFAVTAIDMIHKYKRKRFLARILQILLSFAFIVIIFHLGYKGQNQVLLDQILKICISIILLIPLPHPIYDFQPYNRDYGIYLLPLILMFGVVLWGMFP